MSLNIFSITYSTKILTLVIAPVLCILVGILCEFPILPNMYILVPPQEGGVPLPPGGTDMHTNFRAQLSKILHNSMLYQNFFVILAHICTIYLSGTQEPLPWLGTLSKNS